MDLITPATAIIRTITLDHRETGVMVGLMAVIIPTITTKIIITTVLSPGRARCQATIIMNTEMPLRQEGTIILSVGQNPWLTVMTDMSLLQEETITLAAEGQASTGITTTTLQIGAVGMGDREKIQNQVLALSF
ncbi:hypothetical protein [Methyloglobulus sp.]|uniref:hypothetical protein n=1 Tax=Methyloglobulus sp. TaxID=2518622 RepID=UPI0039897C12